jgi:hypothetical protein
MWAVDGQTTTVEGKVAATVTFFRERSDWRPQAQKTTTAPRYTMQNLGTLERLS